MPFLTITLGPQPSPAAPAAGPGGGTMERLAFYGGVATMGALGVLDWPVAAAIAAGTWVAQHTLPVRGRPAAAPGRAGGSAAQSANNGTTAG